MLCIRYGQEFRFSLSFTRDADQDVEQVFAQLIMFCALAAFTRDFDITTGIAANPDAALADALFIQAGTEDQYGLVASRFRSNRLPQLNARGLSLTMAYSRVLLLLQYSVGA